ncbi:hypothetical protein CVT26_006510 [Gymnopilus dilepis]|uniref:Uncharacterized protein n=1 Tax=Gymnopilus dilepis TaxID=231916 RepID=A0A409W6H6_9AGAR|nr:hypothetical protein CVT26_006510 [Gymnopilus dilepis]
MAYPHRPPGLSEPSRDDALHAQDGDIESPLSEPSASDGDSRNCSAIQGMSTATERNRAGSLSHHSPIKLASHYNSTTSLPLGGEQYQLRPLLLPASLGLQNASESEFTTPSTPDKPDGGPGESRKGIFACIPKICPLRFPGWPKAQKNWFSDKLEAPNWPWLALHAVISALAYPLLSTCVRFSNGATLSRARLLVNVGSLLIGFAWGITLTKLARDVVLAIGRFYLYALLLKR